MHALRLGREYTEPFQGFGKDDKREISSLCENACNLTRSHASYGLGTRVVKP